MALSEYEDAIDTSPGTKGLQTVSALCAGTQEGATLGGEHRRELQRLAMPLMTGMAGIKAVLNIL
jgi:hypothetical protein